MSAVYVIHNIFHCIMTLCDMFFNLLFFSLQIESGSQRNASRTWFVFLIRISPIFAVCWCTSNFIILQITHRNGTQKTEDTWINFEIDNNLRSYLGGSDIGFLAHRRETIFLLFSFLFLAVYYRYYSLLLYLDPTK